MKEILAKANPFFDDILIFLEDLPSSQDKLKPIDPQKKLFELIEKNNVTEFKKRMRNRLENKRKPNWPYTTELYMSLTISGLKKDVYDKDLDNLLKTLFDTLKGIVFEDDRLVTKLSAEKEITDEYKGILVGLKVLTPTDDILLSPDIFTTSEDYWECERNEKMRLGKHTYFEYY
jgi:Holliday junction resolvase RusA-like endonuclease